VQGLVALLGKLPPSAVRSHYLQQVAERLSGGQARLALQLEDDLRQQVKGQRWHGRSTRWEQPGEAGLRERAEAEVLRLYLHCPSYRGAIRSELRRRELEDFALQHHRQLWAAISSLEEDNLAGATRQDGAGRLEAINRGLDPGHDLFELDLPRLLADQLLVEQSELLNRLTPLLEPNEVQRLSLAQPLLQLRGTTAALERQRSLKRCRHLLDAWSSQRLETLERCIALLLAEGQPGAQPPAGAAAAGAAGSGPAAAPGSGLSPAIDMETRIDAMFADLNRDALHFQELYYNERQHIGHLDQQRCAGYEEIMQEAAPPSPLESAPELLSA
jgi:DNA primase